MAAAFKDPKFGDGYDVIIYDICFGEKWNDGDYDPALQLATEGKPAVFLHCSMHTYRPPRDKKAPDLNEREAIADANGTPWSAWIRASMTSMTASPPRKSRRTIRSSRLSRRLENPRRRDVQHHQDDAHRHPAAPGHEPRSGKVHTVAWINHTARRRSSAPRSATT